MQYQRLPKSTEYNHERNLGCQDSVTASSEKHNSSDDLFFSIPFEWCSNTRFHGNKETFRYIHNSSHQLFRMLLTPQSALSWQTGIYSCGTSATSWSDKLQATWPKLCQSRHVEHSSFRGTAVECSPPGNRTKCLIIYVAIGNTWMWR
jgi:hypothetical protein